MILTLDDIKAASPGVSLDEATRNYAITRLTALGNNISATCRELMITRARLYRILGGKPDVQYIRPKIKLGLSERQLEVVRLVLIGLPNQAIASQLGIKVKTVKYHLSDVYKILQVKGRHALMAKLVGQHV